MTSNFEEFAKSIDPRTSLFDVRIDSQSNGILKLSGRVLDKSQLDELPRLLPTRQLDTSSIRVLNAEKHEAVHVMTNLTGLYEKPTFGMALSSELTYGTDLEVLDEQGKWVFTRQHDGYLGWAYRSYLGVGTAPEPTHLVLGPAIEMRFEPDETSGILTRLLSGTRVVCNRSVNEEENGRTDLSTDGLSTDGNGCTDRASTDGDGCTDGVNGWVHVRANETGWVQSRHLRAVRDLPKTLEEKQNTMIEDFQRMIGIPYLWGGVSGNGIDCSGFARLLHHWLGVEIPRDADMQHAAARPAEPPYEIGDLFFFAESDSDRKITHVGVSLGGWKMVHSSRKRNGVYVDDLQQRKDLIEVFVNAGSFLRK